MRALVVLRMAQCQLPPIINEHQPLISTLPRPTLRRAVRMLELIGELRRDVEDGRRKVNAVVRDLAHHRHRRWTRRFHFAHDIAGLKAELSVEFPRQLLHASIFGEAKHMQVLDLPVARREQHALEQCRSHAAALPRPLDAQRRLGFAGARKQAQLGSAA